MALNLGEARFGVTSDSRKARRDLASLTETLRNLESASVLAVGPLSGLGARIRALSAITTRSRASAALFLGSIAAVTVGVLELGQAAVRSARELERINGRLITFTDSAIVAEQVLEEIGRIADTSGLDIQQAATSFSQLAAAAKNTALEGQPIIEVFRGVSSAAAALRLSTEEVNGILRALQQTISKGRVQAEELRGQFGERLPGGFKLAADALGVTTAELSRLLEAGEVVAEDLLPKLGRELQRRFGTGEESVDSFAASVNRLTSAWFQFTAQVDEVFDVSGRLKGVLDFLADAVRTVSETLSPGIGIVEVIEDIDQFIERAELLGRVAPFSFRRLRLTAAVELEALQEEIAKTQAFVDERLGAGLAVSGSVIGKLDTLRERAGQLQDAISRLDIASVFATAAERITEPTKETERLTTKIRDLAREAFGARQAFESGGIFGPNLTQDFLDLAKAEELLVDVSKQGSEQLAFLAAALREFGFEGENVKVQLAALLKANREATDSVEDLQERFENTAEVVPRLARDVKLLQDEIAALEQPQPLRIFEEEATIKERVRAFREDLNTTALSFEDINSRTAEFETNLRRLNDAELARSKDTFTGLVEGLDDAQREFGALGELVRGQIPRAFQTAEDALVEFVTTGKFEIKSLVDFIIAELARLAIRQAIIGPLSSSLAGAFGGGATSTATGTTGTLPKAGGFSFTGAGTPGLARGGVITSPGVFVGGEAGKEAVLPLKRGSGGRLGVAAEGGGGTVVQVNIINNTDSEVGVSRRQSQSGQEQLDVTIDKIMARQVSNQGEFNKSLRSNFLINPRVAGR